LKYLILLFLFSCAEPNRIYESDSVSITIEDNLTCEEIAIVLENNFSDELSHYYEENCGEEDVKNTR